MAISYNYKYNTIFTEKKLIKKIIKNNNNNKQTNKNKKTYAIAITRTSIKATHLHYKVENTMNIKIRYRYIIEKRIREPKKYTKKFMVIVFIHR